MNTTNNESIRNIVAQRKKAHKLYRENSKVYQAFVEMEQRTYQDGALDKKHKELIATGISAVINCESCMEWHINRLSIREPHRKKLSKPSRWGLK